MLKLPTPLPYDVVDKMIEKEYTFNQSEWGDSGDLMYTACYRRDAGPLGNYDRMLAETIEDISKYETEKEEDSEGYIEWHSGGSGMIWTANWTDADTEERWNEIFDPDDEEE